ncbi:MAG: LEA type 2 family protein [Alphaproteobacteria bacterium]
MTQGKAGGRNGTVTMLVLVAATAFLVTACVSVENAKPPQVHLADMKFVGGGLFAQQVELGLIVGNPNNFELPLEGMTFRLDVNGAKFAEGFTNQSFTLPRLGEVAVPVRATTSLIELVRQALVLGQKGELDYEITGVAYVAGLSGREVPYEQSGTLRLLPEGMGGASGADIHTFAPK